MTHTWQDLFKLYGFDNFSTEDQNFFLWERTAYPLSNIRHTTEQLYSALRAFKHGRRLCIRCGKCTKSPLNYLCNDKHLD